MSLKAIFFKHVSEFIIPGGTSRGVLTTKDSYIIHISRHDCPEIIGVGEISVIDNLSIDAVENLEEVVDFVCKNINSIHFFYKQLLVSYPAICFGLEMALIDLQNGGKQIYFPSDFVEQRGEIHINGLVWMGSIDFMLKQVDEKIKDNYSCLKFKVGANDFEKEVAFLKELRSSFLPSRLEIRLDANGAFGLEDALVKLNSLAQFEIHSIEQPIKAGNWSAMGDLCRLSPIKIALDEELIGVSAKSCREQLLSVIKPDYLILKPSLLGGFASCDEWTNLADVYGIKYWITSALETNIGLNAIAQWCYTKHIQMAQGLGTGKLFSNNFKSPLVLISDKMVYQIEQK